MGIARSVEQQLLVAIRLHPSLANIAFEEIALIAGEHGVKWYFAQCRIGLVMTVAVVADKKPPDGGGLNIH